MRASSSSSLAASNSTPVMRLRSVSSASFHSPIWRAISVAVAAVSPVTILTAMPADMHSATAAGTSSRTGSAIAAHGRQAVRLLRLFDPRGVRRDVGQRQRAHGAALHTQQLFLNFGGDRRGVAARRAPLRAHPLMSREPLPCIASLNERSHVFAFGREGQPVENPHPFAQCGVVAVFAPEPFEQRAFGGVAQRTAVGVERRRSSWPPPTRRAAARREARSG